MKRCQKKKDITAQRLPRGLTMCLRRVVPGHRVCADHFEGVLPREEMIYQALNPLADYVESEIERDRRIRAWMKARSDEILESDEEHQAAQEWLDETVDTGEPLRREVATRAATDGLPLTESERLRIVEETAEAWGNLDQPRSRRQLIERKRLRVQR